MIESPAPFSWNTHALITRAALRGEGYDRLSAETGVEPIESFLEQAASQLPGIIEPYLRRIDEKTGNSRNQGTNFGNLRSALDFLVALRLNPRKGLPYVTAPRPDRINPSAPHDPLRAVPPSNSYPAREPGQTMKESDILITFSDEPDWGMDQELFVIPEYDYGKSPYGPDYGISSQAPFHMAFLNEGRILTALHPRLKRNFMEERITVFRELAECAAKIGSVYWAGRFSAWALHYVQDLAQPFHACALPFPRVEILTNLIRTRSPRQVVDVYSHRLRNRHLVFEATMHSVLNEEAKQGRDDLLNSVGGSDRLDVVSSRELMYAVGLPAARAAYPLNAALGNLVAGTDLDRSDVLLADDGTIPVHEMLKDLIVRRETEYRVLLDRVRPVLHLAGTVTRTLVDSSRL